MRPRSLPTIVAEDAPDLRGTVDSLQRGLEVLRAFRAGENTLPLGEIAARIGLSRATAARLIQTLIAHAFLRQIPGTDQYCPDVACQIVGNAVLSTDALVRAATPIMGNLAARFDASLTLAVRDRTSMLCLAEKREARRAAAPSAQGRSWPIAATVLGRAWLWAQSAPLQGEIIQRIRADADSAQQTTRAMPNVYRAFQELELTGYCSEQIAAGERMWMLGAPLPLGQGSLGQSSLGAGSLGAGSSIAVPSSAGFVAALSCEIRGPRGEDQTLRAEVADAVLGAVRDIRQAAAI